MFSIEFICQFCGILIPAIGIMILLKKEQNRAGTYLMLANIGCLIINSCYLLILRSQRMDEALLALKMEYIGNALFYYFFAIFLASYLRIWIPWYLLGAWIVFEVAQLVVIWNDNYNNMFFNDMNYKLGDKTGMHYITTEAGTFYSLRYGMIAIALVILLITTLYRYKMTKMQYEKKNLVKLIIAQCVIVISLSITIFAKSQYDVVPVCSSISVVFIIMSVAKGDMFNVLDRGRTWVFDTTQDMYIMVDSCYGFIDANKLAYRKYPELKMLKKNQEIPQNVKVLFAENSNVAEDDNDELIDDKLCKSADSSTQKIIEEIKDKNIDIDVVKETEIVIDDRFYEKKVSSITEKNVLLGYSLMLTDVTRQHELIEEVRKERDRAEEANRSKSAFLSNMSHEIRTPMNAIVGMTEILLREKWPKKEEGYLINVKNSGKALLLIINDILDFSKIESGKLEIIEEKYEPMSMLRDLSMIFLNRIGDKDVELIFDIDKELPHIMYGDSLRIRQIIINIVNNAIKFTDKGYVKLTINCKKEEEDSVRLYISVKDSGQGIKEDELSKLFGAFNQVDTKKNRQKEGTGLGLAISKQLVEMMDGSIHVNSKYGVGSEFELDIRQKVIEDTPAASIREDISIEELTISGKFESGEQTEMILRLASQYKIEYVPYNEIGKRKIRYFIADYNSYEAMDDKIKLQFQEAETKVCIMQNPMRENIDGRKMRVINKPLYTLNFCQFINNEEQELLAEDTNDINYIAPEAKILLVDDNELNIKVALGLMAPLKMQIDTAIDGRSAVDMIKKNRYDLVLMDHMMPIMDGVEATAIIRKMEGDYYSKLPIIALTANAVSGAKEEFIKAGMNDFVGKPIDMKDMAMKLKKWLPKEKICKCVNKQMETKVIQEDISDIPAVEKIGIEDISDIPAIEGIDIEEGIKNCGSKKMFLSLLGDYYRLIDIKGTKLKRCLEDGLIRDFTIEVHALKNTSRMIGALELSERFLRLENYGNANDIESIEREFEETYDLFKNYKKVLKSFGKTDELFKREITPDYAISLFDGLMNSVNEFDLDKTDQIMKELEQCRLPDECSDKMELLRAYVADVAMEDIINIAGEIIEILRNNM